MPIKIKILCKVKTCHKNLKFLFNQYQSLWSCFLSRKSLKSVKDAFLGHPIYQFLRNLEFLNFIFNGIKLPWPSRFQKYVSMFADFNCHDPPSRQLWHGTKVINWLKQCSLFFITLVIIKYWFFSDF